MCPQAYAGVRKRTCVGGSLQAPGLIMFWARVRKTAGPLKCEKIPLSKFRKGSSPKEWMEACPYRAREDMR